MTKTALITGANGNLGRAVVTHFLKKGYRVVGFVHSHRPQTTNPKNYEEFEVDLLNEVATKNAVELVINKYKHLAVSVLTAGGFAMGKIEDTTDELLEAQYALNFKTAYHVARPLINLLQTTEENGKLFFIGSMPGLNTHKAASTVAYSLAKSQLFQLANIINVNRDKTGIWAHVVVPSTIDTPQNREAVPQADFSQWEKPATIAKVIEHYTQQYDKLVNPIISKDEL